MQDLLSKWRQRVMQVKQEKAMQELPGNPYEDASESEEGVSAWL